MREIVKYTYVADDGTEFDDEFECLKYEEKNLPDGVVTGLDENLEIIDPKSAGWEDWFQKVYYIVINDSQKASELFAFLVDMYGYCLPEGFMLGDVMAYRMDGDWINLTEQATALWSEMNKVLEAVGAKKSGQIEQK